MPIRKSIRDVQTSNNISDIVSTESIKKPKIKKTVVKDIFEPQVSVSVNKKQSDAEIDTENFITMNKKTDSMSKYKKVLKTIYQIKPIYIISFVIILLGASALLFIPSNKTKDPLEQSKKESEMVKKQFSKHIILPESEQIDIRKITNKMEDPFFKDAEVGDYLIIFYKNRIAYIYSIDKDIIINAGVVFIDPKTATTTSTTKTQ